MGAKGAQLCTRRERTLTSFVGRGGANCRITTGPHAQLPNCSEVPDTPPPPPGNRPP